MASDRNRRWLYRGHRCYEWDLEPKLQRTIQRFDLPLRRQVTWEYNLCREFKRHLHRYTTDLPEERDTFRWLALMQHHGAPTRLLDFTYSAYVAVFIAIERAKPGERAALWVLDHNWCWKRARRLLPQPVYDMVKRDSKSVDTTRALLQTRRVLAVPVNSRLLDERLAVQQGVFLCPLNLGRTFSANLGVGPNLTRLTGPAIKIALDCTHDFLTDALGRLHEMNISRLSLFPGIDGLAQSLENTVAMPWRFLEREWHRRHPEPDDV